MGLWDKVTGQFIDVIEWEDSTNDTLVWKFPSRDNEIKNGAQLIVRESQCAVFMHEGELGDIFHPGRHKLSTSNIPILTTLSSWKYAFDAPFKCDIYFVSTRQFTDLKWGTKNPVMLRDPEFGPLRLRAFGNYCIQICDAAKFIKQISGTDSLFQTDEITGQFRNMLVSRFSDALAESKIPALDLAASYNELGGLLLEKLQTEFDNYGTNLKSFLVENISLPKSVEEALDKRAQMGILGNLDNYSKLQTANAIGDMANNPNGGGNMMGMIAGMNMGNVVGGAVQQSAIQPQAAVPPPIPTAVQWFAAIDGKQVGPFDEKSLGDFIRQNRITRETLVWRQGMAAWMQAGKIADLTGYFNNQPPPLPLV